MVVVWRGGSQPGDHRRRSRRTNREGAESGGCGKDRRSDGFKFDEGDNECSKEECQNKGAEWPGN